MLFLRDKGFHEFFLTILPWSLLSFNTLMDFFYSTFVSQLFISKDSLMFRLCMLGSCMLHDLLNRRMSESLEII